MGKNHMSIFAVLLALTSTFSSAADVEIPLEKYELPNGLDVILAPDRSTPIVYVSIWYHVGSKDERTGLTGFAHLFEHLMFQGSLSNDGEYFAPLERLGASINGTTSFDRTNYYEVLPSQHLPVALFVESDRMGYLLDVLSQEKLDNQREVVRNERRQNVEDRPYGNAYQLLLQGIYPPSHPYSHLPIGSHEDLQAASLEDVIAFFQTWYVPNNASLVVAGDIDIDATKQMIRTHFGGIPAGPQPERIEAQPVTMTEGKRIVDYDDVPEQRVWMAWHSPRLFQEGDAELDLLASTLTAGEDSRLVKTLVREKRLAKDIVSYQQSGLLSSTFVIRATANPDHTTAELVTEIQAALREIWSTAPPTDKEIESARTTYERSFYDRISTIAGKAETLQSYNLHVGDPNYIQQDLSRYLQVTKEGTLNTGKTILSQPFVEVHILPLKDKPTEADADQGGE